MSPGRVLTALTGGGLAGALALAITASPLSAAETAGSGWWTSAPSLATADVPEDGLLVQGGADGPVAYAAVAFELQSDEQATSLRLEVVPDSIATSEASLTLCPLTDPFHPAHGAPMDDAPRYDCTEGIPATAAEDRTMFAFDLRGLPVGEAITMAVISALPIDRVVLQRPTVDNLRTQFGHRGPNATSPHPSEMGTGAAVESVPGPAPGMTLPPPLDGIPSPSVPVPFALPPPPGTNPAEGSATEQADQLKSLALPPLAGSVSPLGDEGGLAGRLAFVATLVGAIGAWVYAGHRQVYTAQAEQ